MAADKDLWNLSNGWEKARAATAVSLTYFEFTTLAAAEIIAAQNCDFALLEVGMGGRLDAVNVFPPAVSVVSGVGLDHCDYLGDTVEKIAVGKSRYFSQSTTGGYRTARSPRIPACRRPKSRRAFAGDGG